MKVGYYLGSPTASGNVNQIRSEFIAALQSQLSMSPSYNKGAPSKADFKTAQGRVQVYSVQGSGDDRGFNVTASGIDIGDTVLALARSNPGLEYTITSPHTASPSESTRRMGHAQSGSP